MWCKGTNFYPFRQEIPVLCVAMAVREACQGKIRVRQKNIVMNQGFVGDIRSIIDKARAMAVRSVDFSRVQMYWNIGRRIFEEEQQGKERADYGTYLIRHLAKELEPEYGSGFSVRQLEQSRQFYRTYPIANTLRSQLNWSQYRRLIQIENSAQNGAAG